MQGGRRDGRAGVDAHIVDKPPVVRDRSIRSKAETKASFDPEAVAQAWKRINFSVDVPQKLVAKSVQDAKDAGFLKGSTDTSKLIENP